MTTAAECAVEAAAMEATTEATHRMATAVEATAAEADAMEAAHRMAAMEAATESTDRGVVMPMPHGAVMVTMPSPQTAETPNDPKNKNHSQHVDALLSRGISQTVNRSFNHHRLTVISKHRGVQRTISNRRIVNLRV